MLFKKYLFGKSQNATIADIILEQPKSKFKVSDAKNSNGLYPFYTSGKTILEFDQYIVDGENLFLNTGGTADVKFNIGKTCYSTDTWCISAKQHMTAYLYLVLVDKIEEINFAYFEGSALKHLKKDKLKEMPIYISNDNEFLKFNSKINIIYNQYNKNHNLIKSLKKLLNTSLPKLMLEISEC